jgi:uncharacterized repeat protein (TIGR03837 family)
MKTLVTCDIFCTVVDNYGDIGVCWRLARQLAHEHNVAVRMWVDDLASFRRLCPEVDASLAQQHCRGVEVRHWAAPFPGGEPAQLVIEAFSCKLPQSYIEAMVVQEHEPVWINLEFLSAEDWVEGCHKLPSPHPLLPLTKYFFFPGFTPKTGGLLLERDLLARRDSFRNNAGQHQAFWQSISMPAPAPETFKVSMFCYENTALQGLFDAWVNGAQAVLCLVPDGRILPQAGQYFGDAAPLVGNAYSRGNLEVRVLPFMEQERYDELLWACDANFVRGEDSFVRAQLAGKPCVWHIYPQHDNVHMRKLRAFMALYCAGLPPDAAQALHGLWEEWNGGPGLGQATSPFDTSGNSVYDASTRHLAQRATEGAGHAWNDFFAHEPIFRQHAHDWAQQLSGNSLTLNLLDFFRSIDRMRDSENLA